MYNLGPGKEIASAAKELPENVGAGLEMILAPTDFMTMGAGGAGHAIFIGAKGFKKLEKAGLADMAIDAGTFPDGMPRWEISDAGQETSFAKMKTNQIRHGRESVDATQLFPEHEALHTAYPELKEYNVGFREAGGTHNAKKKKISIGTRGDMQSTALHELNHAVDAIEGHAKGGSPQAELGRLVKNLDDESSERLRQVQRTGRAMLKEHGVERYEDLPPEATAKLKEMYADLNKYNAAEVMPELKQAAMEDYIGLAGEQSSNLTELRKDMSLEDREFYSALDQAQDHGAWPGKGYAPEDKVRMPDDWDVRMPDESSAVEASVQATKTKYFESHAVGNSGDADVRDFGMLSGAKKGATPEANAKANKQLQGILEERFGNVVNMKGRYDGVDEDSFMVEDLKLEDYDDLMAIAKEFGQESVMTPRGLLYVTGINAGKMHPLNSKVPTRLDGSEPDNFSSIVTKQMTGPDAPTKFAYDIDFDTLIDIPTAESVSPHLQSKRGTHFSNTEGLTEIDPAKYGTGGAGAEKKRVAEGAAPRSFAYEALNNALPIKAESMVPQKASYTTDYRDVYDMDADPANLKAYALGETDMENIARMLGARGVSSGRLADEGANRAGAIAYFDKQNVGTVEGQQISARNPTSPKRLVDPEVEQLSPNLASAMENPAQFEKMTRLLQENTPLRAALKDADPETAAEAYISMVQGNLNFLWNETNPAIREISRKWYEGANLIARNMADQYGVPLESAAGVLAALSPQKDWYQNVALAEAIMDIMRTKGGVGWSSKMDGAIDKVFDASKPEHERLLANIAGKRLDELTDPVEQAAWARLYDTGHSKRNFSIYAPDGTKGGLFLTKAGNPGTYGWQSFGASAQAIRALESGADMKIISPAMGNQHKVRSFYNNIVAPMTGRDVTMDTHAVAGGLMLPVGGSHPAVAQNLGAGTGSAITGNRGTYALNAEAYLRAADEQGVLPREMQSVVWETVRGLFNNKSKPIQDAASAIWLEYKNGIIGQSAENNGVSRWHQQTNLVQLIQS
jgi:hypothetical protein